MTNYDQRIVGSYSGEQETKRVIRHLMDQGYRKDQLTIYTNENKDHLYSEVENVKVAQPDAEKNTHDAIDTPEEDKNFWESIRDAFHVREDHEFDNQTDTSGNDLLSPYRDDLKNGYYIVAVDDTDRPAGAQDTASDKETINSPNPEMETLGTIAGFPNEGSVQGMGDGGQPPVASQTEDGTPPELEDTAAAADEQEATEDRLSQERRKNHKE